MSMSSGGGQRRQTGRRAVVDPPTAEAPRVRVVVDAGPVADRFVDDV